MSKLPVQASYGEIWCPDSMRYEHEEKTVLNVQLNPNYDNDEMQEMLRKIDDIVRQYLEVLN